ncbi:hypoxanthine phosphoribosyltransferase [Akkermansiaceae bacterium]|nr:hypoxanthine phosphoribosyltransferase [Akkermansiaceae bacterium]
MRADLEKVLFNESTILARLDELAEEITRDHEGKDLTAIVILHGGIILMADLLRRIQMPLRIESLGASSYHGGTESSGVVKLLGTGLPDVRGKHVLILDDILDTGRTLQLVKSKLLEGEAAGVKTCVLLSKKVIRAVEVNADYVGFEIEDEFVVGYGLDFDGRYRNLPFIGVLKESVISVGAAMPGIPIQTTP